MSGFRRPYLSHADEGREAYGLSPVDDPPSPYGDGTLADLSWKAGFLDARAQDPFAVMMAVDLAGDDDALEPGDEGRLRLDADASMARSGVRRALAGLARDLPTVAQVEDAIGEPAVRWPLRCAEIASAVLRSGVLDGFQERHGRLREAYGVYDGDIADGSVFPKGIARHGWLEAETGVVVDPTWWVFAAVEPSIRAAGIEDYDLAGLRLRETMYGTRMPPAFNGAGQGLDVSGLGRDALAELSARLSDGNVPGRGSISKAQGHWLANDGGAMLGPHGGAYLGMLLDGGMSAFVPIDVARLLRPDAAGGPSPLR